MTEDLQLQPDESPADKSRLEAGYAALDCGAWEEARACFQSVLETGETPEALEGLGRASWWLDDGPATFRTRERAYQLYRRQEDAYGAARVATDLAYDHFSFAGQRAIANGWLQRAYRLLQDKSPAPEHALLAIMDGFIALAVENDSARAFERAAYAIQLGRELESIDLEMIGLALEGMTWVCVGNIPLGMRNLDESTAAAVSGEMTSLDVRSTICCWMISACEWTRDFSRAAEWCRYVEQLARQNYISLYFEYCRVHYACILIWRGEWKEAEEWLTLAINNLAGTRPAEEGDAVVQLAELRRRQGKFDAAEELLQRARSRPTWQQGRDCMLLVRGHLRYDQGNFAAAREDLSRFLRNIPPQNRMQRVHGLEALSQVCIAAGDLEQAAAATEELQSIVADVNAEPLQAGAHLVAGQLLAAQNQHEQALEHLESACDSYAAGGAPYHHAWAQLHLAQSLHALGRLPGARQHAQTARHEFQRLGAAHALTQADNLLAQMQSETSDTPTSGTTPPANPNLPSGLDQLTPRELDIVRFVATGQSNQEIADNLVLSVRTVERHIYNIYQKLGHSGKASRASLAAFAVRHGLTLDH